MLATTHEHGSQLRVAERAGSSAEVALRSAEFQYQNSCMSKWSLQQEVSRLQSNRTFLEEPFELDAWHGGRTRDYLVSASETNRSLREYISELMAQYDQIFPDLGYDCNSSQDRLYSYDFHSESCHEAFCIGCDRLDACKFPSE